MNFYEALRVFSSKYTEYRLTNDSPVGLNEFLAGFIGLIADTLVSIPEDKRAASLEAVHRALDERMGDPVGEQERLN